MSHVIYHNPSCSTSRTVLATLREAGIEPQVVLYKETPLSVAQLRALCDALGEPPRALLRSKEASYAELGLADPNTSDERILEAIAEHPYANHSVIQPKREQTRRSAITGLKRRNESEPVILDLIGQKCVLQLGIALVSVSCKNHSTTAESRMTVPARLMKLNPRSNVLRSTFFIEGTW